MNWDDIDEVTPASGGSRMGPGTYKVRIQRALENDGHHGLRFVLEMLILEASPGAADPVGSVRSWTRDLTRYPDLAKAEVAAMARAAFPHETQISRLFKRGPDGTFSAMEGAELVTTAFQQKAKNGNLFTKHTWGKADAPIPAGPPPSAPPETPEEAPFPPEGWAPHPSAPGWYFRGQEVVSEADLRKRVA